MVLSKFPLQRFFQKRCQASWGVRLLAVAGLISLLGKPASAVPNGTWLSKPQISFHASSNTLSGVMDRIRKQGYKVVFLDYRYVSDDLQKYVSQEVRRHNLTPIVWIQSPQYRSLTVSQLMDEGRHADGIQVDDHFFANYSLQDFYSLRRQYTKLIYCSIQPFQAEQLPSGGCNQLDVQCYTPESFVDCVQLADRLKAITSLSTQNTLIYQGQLGGRQFNVFLWPHTHEYRYSRLTPKISLLPVWSRSTHKRD